MSHLISKFRHQKDEEFHEFFFGGGGTNPTARPRETQIAGPKFVETKAIKQKKRAIPMPLMTK